MTITAACSCNAQQLHLVGCDCGNEEGPFRVVSYWPKGYAAETGLFKILIGASQDPRTEVRRFGGIQAKVYTVEPERRPVVVQEKFDAEYVRQMSVGG
jgi:hypothetical protein